MSGLLLVSALLFAAACSDPMSSVDDGAVPERMDAHITPGVGVLAAVSGTLVNGNFENSVPLAGWSYSPAANWTISVDGSNVALGSFATPPGPSVPPPPGGPLPPPTVLTLSQDVALAPACALELGWRDRIRWDFSPFIFLPSASMEVQDLDGIVPTLTVASDAAPGETSDTDWLTHTADITAFGGSTVRISFTQTIDLLGGLLSGTSQFSVDDVVISEVGGGTSTPHAALVPVAGKSLKSDKGTFMVVATCEGGCGAGATATATLNGVPVENGQIVKLEVKSKKSKSEKSKSGKSLKLKDTAFELVVECDGATETAHATPVFAEKSKKEKKSKKGKKG